MRAGDQFSITTVLTICAVPTPTGHRRHTGHSTHTQTLQIPYAADTAAATASATAAPTAANAAAAVAAAAAAAPPLLLLLLVATPLESPPVRPWIACDPRGFNSPEARTQAELCMMAGASSPPLVHTSKSAPFMRAGSWVREPREHTCGCCSSCCSCCSCCSCYSCCSCCSCGSCCCSAARSAQGNQAGVGLGASLRRWPKRRALLPVSRGRALVLKSRVTDGGRARATRRPSMALGCNQLS